MSTRSQTVAACVAPGSYHGSKKVLEISTLTYQSFLDMETALALLNALQFEGGGLVSKGICQNWSLMPSFAGLSYGIKVSVRISGAKPSETPRTAKELSYSDDVVLQQKILVWGSSGDPHYHPGLQQLWER